jgi:glycolate oxidase iron-sulfur subunit
MRTDFTKAYSESEDGKIANDILRRCVHCGFCNATCPTYQLLGDELDGPRGRIYLIKQMLEGNEITKQSQTHLDRCLLCRACETTCPSGVEYSRLLEIGRSIVEEKVPRSSWETLKRNTLNSILPRLQQYRWLLAMGRFFRFMIPASMESGLAVKAPSLAFPSSNHQRRMLLLKGCVQSQLAPDINRATARVLDKLGITLIEEQQDNACCGAISQHLGKVEVARNIMRKNIDAWWPAVENGVEAIVVTASGCAPHVKDYGHLLRHDTHYAEKARCISDLTRDVSEVVAAADVAGLKKLNRPIKVAFHAPCSLQHGQKLAGVVEAQLTALGYELCTVKDAHLCCGAAGTYTILQPEISEKLLINKLVALEKDKPQVIATANIGCLLHLQADASAPVKHWMELLVEHNV